MSGSVLAIGAIMVDVVCHVPSLPHRGEGVVVQRQETMIGGCAYNSAQIIRQLGSSVYLCAPVGQGVFADFVRKELAIQGLDFLSVTSTLDNGACTCLVEPDGERTMITSPGVERCFEKAWFDAIDVSRFDKALASGYEIEGAGGNAIISFLERHPSLEFFYAPGPRIAGVGQKKTARINALNPIWHLNDLEARAYTGESTLCAAAHAIMAQSGNAVIVTEGAQGSHVFLDDDHVMVPTRPIDPVDTVGAGDAHLGALVAARSAGLCWEQALSLANAVAGAVCGISGASFSDDAFGRLGFELEPDRVLSVGARLPDVNSPGVPHC